MYPRSIQSIAIILSSILVLSSCQKEPDSIIVTDEITPAAMLPYFAEFEYQASLRGFQYSISEAGITAEFRNVDQGNVAGICTTNNNNYRLITIDLDFWNTAPNTIKEMIVFHELGHCFLGRGHREDAFANGLCRSIMRSGTGTCQDAYNSQNRAYYLDELFFGED